MILLFILYSLCGDQIGKLESSVVKIVHENGAGKENPIMPQGDNIVGAPKMSSENTEWVITRDKENRNKVEITPMSNQEQRLAVDKDGRLKLEQKDGTPKKWKVKKVRGHHQISFDGHCLTMDDDLNIKSSRCDPNDDNQLFIISKRNDGKVKRPKHDHDSKVTSEYDVTTDEEYEHGHPVLYFPQQVRLQPELVPQADIENVHFTVTSTEVVKSILTLSDTTLKTIYETKTIYVTSTATETKSLDYTKTITSTTVSTLIETTTIEEKAPKRKKRDIEYDDLPLAPKIKKLDRKKKEEQEEKESENIKDAVQLVSNVFDRIPEKQPKSDNDLENIVRLIDDDKEILSFKNSDIFKDSKENCKPSACQQPIVIDVRNSDTNPQKMQVPTQTTCYPIVNMAQQPIVQPGYQNPC